ncbi:hypothetical protein [Ruminococcus flavefaciens]|uniref:hypothetical protein n=1 Tax=Ruminococcus flavefaciens TaxID=1265 RepID=UPI0002D2E3A9|nr:hypothetical protein [Ruminococcus flavefaciens]
MFKTFRISFMLKNTYRTNAILHGIKQLPFIGKLIPDTVYGMPAFKIIAYVIAIIYEISTLLIWKLAYFFFFIALWTMIGDVSRQLQPEFFLHLLIPLTITGAFIHNFMFEAEKHKYYAMMQLNMDSRQFTLVNYFYELAKYFIGFLICGLLFGLILGLHIWECLLIPVFAASAKTLVCAYQINRFKRGKPVTNSSSLLKNGLLLIGLCLFIPGLYITGLLGFTIPRYASWAIMAFVIAGTALTCRSIFSFTEYRAMNKEILSSQLINQMDKSAQRRMIVDRNRKIISLDKNISSNKNGFEYLNELFIKRHRKTLWGNSIIITAVISGLIILASVVCIMVPKVGSGLNETLMRSLPYFCIIMYAINRGMYFTQALFMNCDHSLLTYSFYKEPKSILSLFRIRLREITKVNLLPAATGGAGLALLLFLSGGTDNPINYAVLFVSICAMSIFFSVHYLTIYYLLQPYNAGTEIKSGTYQVINIGTYMVCFFFMNVKLPTLYFGLSTIAFCVLYCIIACILVYKFAPKTFRIRT